MVSFLHLNVNDLNGCAVGFYSETLSSGVCCKCLFTFASSGGLVNGQVINGFVLQESVTILL